MIEVGDFEDPRQSRMPTPSEITSMLFGFGNF